MSQPEVVAFDAKALKEIKYISEDNEKLFEPWVKTLSLTQQALYRAVIRKDEDSQNSFLSSEGVQSLFDYIEAFSVPPLEYKGMEGEKKKKVAREVELSPERPQGVSSFSTPKFSPFLSTRRVIGLEEEQESETAKPRAEVEKIVIKSALNSKELDRQEDPVPWLANIYSVVTSLMNLSESDKIRILKSVVGRALGAC